MLESGSGLYYCIIGLAALFVWPFSFPVRREVPLFTRLRVQPLERRPAR